MASLMNRMKIIGGCKLFVCGVPQAKNRSESLLTFKFWKGVFISALILGINTFSLAAGEIVSDGLILHLDAAEQIKTGGMKSDNKIWQNLANQPDSVAGAATLHNFQFDGQTGWVGS